MTVRDLLSDETKWCQNAIGYKENGKEARCAKDLQICKSWCLAGAIFVCYEDYQDQKKAMKKVMHVILSETLPLVLIPEVYNFEPRIFVWNDAPERTFADIRRVVEKAEI